MPQPTREVVVAMSGGLDSSVAAALLKRGGWKVRGLHFLLPATPSSARGRLAAARRVADWLQVPLEAVDLTERFRRKVVAPFVDAYVQGLTPNPCVVCNELIKFASLLHWVEGRGTGFLATGHYARLMRGEGCAGTALLRGKATGKDQSYFLHRVGQACLSRTIFPLGDKQKDEVRVLARTMGLPVSSSRESQEICFLPEKNYRLFVEREGAGRIKPAGTFLNEEGEVLGRHDGAYRFTIGQRHGMGIASSRPFYVKEIRPLTNEVVVARREALFSDTVEAGHFSWVLGVPSRRVVKVRAQIRYRHLAAPGRLEVLSPQRVRCTFDEPQWAVTPGQALVCYQGDRVLGGGWIERPGPPDPDS